MLIKYDRIVTYLVSDTLEYSSAFVIIKGWGIKILQAAIKSHRMIKVT